MSLLGAGALSLDPPPFSFKGEPPQKIGHFFGCAEFCWGGDDFFDGWRIFRSFLLGCFACLG